MVITDPTPPENYCLHSFHTEGYTASPEGWGLVELRSVGSLSWSPSPAPRPSWDSGDQPGKGERQGVVDSMPAL